MTTKRERRSLEWSAGYRHGRYLRTRLILLKHWWLQHVMGWIPTCSSCELSGEPNYGTSCCELCREHPEAKLAEVLAALQPFTSIEPSTLYHNAENEGYLVYLHGKEDLKPDFHRQDVIRARDVYARHIK